LRDVERGSEKPSGVFRIAIFGDSMTEGVQVNLDETFTQQLEMRLRRRGFRVEVLNFGVNGYSPLQEYLLYLHAGRIYQPDLILQAVFLDNDVADGHPDLATSQGGAPLLHRTPDGNLVVRSHPAAHSARSYESEPLATIRATSALYRYISHLRWSRRNVVAARAREVGGVQRRYLLYTQPTPEIWNDAWGRLQFIISTFEREARAGGSRFAVVSVPAGQVADPRAWQSLLDEHPAMQALRWDVDAPERRLKQITADLQVPMLAPLDEFRRASSKEPLFFGRVGHFTPSGHALLAELLERWLIESGQIPRPAN
jgi:hypothetical protein